MKPKQSCGISIEKDFQCGAACWKWNMVEFGCLFVCDEWGWHNDIKAYGNKLIRPTTNDESPHLWWLSPEMCGCKHVSNDRTVGGIGETVVKWRAYLEGTQIMFCMLFFNWYGWQQSQSNNTAFNWTMLNLKNMTPISGAKQSSVLSASLLQNSLDIIIHCYHNISIIKCSI